MAIAPLPNTTVQVLEGLDQQLTLPWRRWFQQLATATGTQGPPGAAGPAGPRGASGTTSGLEFVDLASNDWELIAGQGIGLSPSPSYGGPTTISALLASGVIGWDGDDGEAGSPGPPGAAGATGATGPQGPPGASGQSLIGPPGQDGEPGEDGWPIPGPQGNPGAAGSAGAVGAPGQMGPPGWDGDNADEPWIIPSGEPLGVLALPAIVTSGAQTSVTFSGIPGSFNHMRIIVAGASANAGTGNDAVICQFNADAAAHYQWYQGIIQNQGGSAVVTSSGGSGASLVTNPTIGYMDDASATIKMGLLEAIVGGYAQTTFAKAVSWTSPSMPTEAFTNNFTVSGMMKWNQTSAITSFKLTLASGSAFANGTIVSVLLEV